MTNLSGTNISLGCFDDDFLGTYFTNKKYEEFKFVEDISSYFNWVGFLFPVFKMLCYFFVGQCLGGSDAIVLGFHYLAMENVDFPFFIALVHVIRWLVCLGCLISICWIPLDVITDALSIYNRGRKSPGCKLSAREITKLVNTLPNFKPYIISYRLGKGIMPYTEIDGADFFLFTVYKNDESLWKSTTMEVEMINGDFLSCLLLRCVYSYAIFDKKRKEKKDSKEKARQAKLDLKKENKKRRKETINTIIGLLEKERDING